MSGTACVAAISPKRQSTGAAGGSETLRFREKGEPAVADASLVGDVLGLARTRSRERLAHETCSQVNSRTVARCLRASPYSTVNDPPHVVIGERNKPTPRSKPSVSSSGAPAPCITPSSERKVCTVSFKSSSLYELPVLSGTDRRQP